MLTDYFLPHLLGGTERVVYEISKRMIKRGHEVTVLTLNAHGHKEFSRERAIGIHRIPAISLTKLVGAQLTVSPHSLTEANRILKQIQPDIIHAHNLYFNLTAVAPFVKRWRHLPLVTTLHLPKVRYGRAILDGIISLYQRTVCEFIVRSSDKLTAVSKSVLKHAIEDLKVPWSKISIIPNGVDTNAYVPSNRRSENTVITYVGRLIGNKGPQYLIQAAPRILRSHPEVHIHIVGEGPLKTYLVKQVASEKLENNVHFFGNVSDTIPILQETSIFVRSSLTEGMSLAVLEAMACGLPVVASNVEGNAEIVENNITGFLVPPADPGALVEAVEYLLNNPKIAMEMGRRARKKTEKSYDWQKIADLTLEIYSSLI
jgi:glycosyltransferase involved in cell wall biosynthesis